MKEEIKEILEKLKESAENPVFIELDSFTEEGYEVPNYFALDPTNGECKVLLEYIQNLQSQLKAKEEVIKEATEKLRSYITFCENDSQGVYEVCNMAIRNYKNIDKILSKGENK